MNDFSKAIAARRYQACLFGLGRKMAAVVLFLTIFLSSIAAIPASYAAQGGQNIADLSGFWSRPVPGRGAARFDPPESGPGPVVFSAEAGEDRMGMEFIGDDTNPILLPHAAEAVRAQRDMYRRGEAVWSAWALCWPSGVPLTFSMINAVQFLQTDDKVTIIYQRGQTVREVLLNQGHPDDLARTWFGHSIGHYEGTDTLVIDTIAQNPRSLTDRFGTPKSDAMRIVEKYSISADRQRLDVVFHVEGPKTFTTAWSAKFSYFTLPDQGEQGLAFAEIVCPENNRDPVGGDFPIPTATSLDF